MLAFLGIALSAACLVAAAIVGVAALSVAVTVEPEA